MGKIFYFAQSLGVLELFFKDDFRKNGGCATALTGNSEFFLIIVADKSNGFYIQSFFHTDIIRLLRGVVKRIFFIKNIKSGEKSLSSAVVCTIIYNGGIWSALL